ncbi:MAG: DNA internalization-related competence protein ComEC/Rec2 [Mycoplasmatales bacterium]
MKNKVVLLSLLLIYLLIQSIYFNYYKINTDNINTLTVNSDLKIQEYGISFISKINNHKVLVSYNRQINNIEDAYSKIKYGDKFKISNFNVSLIENTYNNPSSFNYKKYMKSKQVKYKLEVKEATFIKHKFSIVTFIKNIRTKLILRNIYRYPTIAPYVNALVFGYNDIDQSTKDIYSVIGVTHLFAISGTHILLIVLFLRYFLSYFKFELSKINKILLVFIPIYIILSGLSHSVIRAGLMIMLAIIFPNIKKKYIFIIVFLINYILNPFIIYSLGFLLSYIITYVLILYAMHINEENKLLYSIKLSILTTLSILPLIININYHINPFMVVSNIIYVPIVTLILLPLSFILTIVNVLPLVWVYKLFIYFMNNLGHIINIFTINIRHFNILMIIIYYVVFILFVNKLHIRFNNKYLKLILIYLILILININILGSVSIIDVGQGDSILIQLPFKQGNVAIDFGNQKSYQEVLTYYNYLGFEEPDIMFITHEHNDHYGSLEELKSMNTNVYSNKDLINKDYIELHNFKFNILHSSIKEENINNDSIVLKVKLGTKEWLFTGDAEKEVEQDLIKDCSNLKSDYLKVGHHGSRSSSTDEFLTCVDPEEAFITSGKNNMYGHPHIETIDKLKKHNIDYYNTQDDGMIKRYFV